MHKLSKRGSEESGGIMAGALEGQGMWDTATTLEVVVEGVEDGPHVAGDDNEATYG